MLEATVRVIVELEFTVVAGDGLVQVPAAQEIDCGLDGALQHDVAAIPKAETSNSR